MAATPTALDPPSSPALPKTPDRGRARTRYPSHLARQLDPEGKPRPLLHRRGTSRTYETLEDLLKEAGYKETRIFTPETERRDPERDDRTRGASAQPKHPGGVGGAVVKLFSAWMPARRPHPAHDAAAPYPPSPLAPRPPNAPSRRLPSPPRSSSSSITVRPAHLPPHPFRPALSASTSSATLALHPHSRARLALRHAASAPHIDKRRVRTHPRAPRPAKPPLPPTWLESLSAALSPRPAPAPPPAPAPAPRTPVLLAHRAHTSPGAVTIATVVCRAAPAHRPRVPGPTLSQTGVADEPAWPPHSPHHLPHDPAAAAAPTDDDEDDELNLTMMLIPSKRQHSIRSLRSVLLQHGPSAPAGLAVRRMRRRIDDEGAEPEGHWDSGEFLTARVKRRRSDLPLNWG